MVEDKDGSGGAPAPKKARVQELEESSDSDDGV